MKSKRRFEYSETVDDVSVVSNIILLQLCKQMREIISCLQAIPFTWKTDILVDSFHQLPPIKAPKYFQAAIVYLAVFLVVELIQNVKRVKVMQQYEDDLSIDILNVTQVS